MAEYISMTQATANRIAKKSGDGIHGICCECQTGAPVARSNESQAELEQAREMDMYDDPVNGFVMAYHEFHGVACNGIGTTPQFVYPVTTE